MTVIVNGRPRTVADGTSLAEVVAHLVGGSPRAVAVALNAEVVPRADWSTTIVRDGDRLEVVGAMQGG
jgi:sulfur carrier protein